MVAQMMWRAGGIGDIIPPQHYTVKNPASWMVKHDRPMTKPLKGI
jgi:hypothetical protein